MTTRIAIEILEDVLQELEDYSTQANWYGYFDSDDGGETQIRWDSMYLLQKEIRDYINSVDQTDQST